MEISKENLLKEHKNLIKVLKSGSKKSRLSEAQKQQKEMKEYYKTKSYLTNMQTDRKIGALKRKVGFGKKGYKPGILYKVSRYCKTESAIKKTGEFQGKSNVLGGGGRFAQVVSKVKGKKGVYNPKGLAAYIGRKSLGKEKFQQLATKGRKHNA